MGHDVLTRGDATENAAGVVALEPARRQLVAMLAALLLGCVRPGPDLNGFDCVDAHQSVGDVRIQPVEYRLAQAGRHSCRNHRDTRTDRIALFPDLPDQRLQLLDARRIGAEKWILIGKRGVHGIQPERAHLAQVTVDPHSQPRRQILARDGAGRDAHDRLASR